MPLLVRPTDVADVAGMQTSASIINTNNTNKANLDIAQQTNQANKDIAQMANEHNEAMLNKQIQQEWDMWNAENEYNSPAAQMQRYADAGVNPYMSVGNVSSGNASSMSSPSAQPAAVPQMQGATMMPANMSGLSGLRGIASRFVEMMQAKEDIKGKQLDNQGKEIENNYKADMFMVHCIRLCRMQVFRARSVLVRISSISSSLKCCLRNLTRRKLILCSGTWKRKVS